MWDRKELKAKGKAAYNANKIACILAALLLMIAGGIGGGYSTSSSVVTRHYMNNDNSQVIDQFDDDLDDSSDFSLEEDDDGLIQIEVNGQDVDTGKLKNSIIPVAIVTSVVITIILIALAVGLLVTALVLNPLNVGARRFFIQNASNPETSVGQENIGVGFGSSYKNIVGAMFGTQMLNLLWALLLIVPGIYKAYCWRLVPFIVADNPDISGREARDMSTSMMEGSKWASFVLDLSFIGWRLLGALTLGILKIVFTNPYQAATDTELYLTLRGASEAEERPAEDLVYVDAEPVE